MDVNDSAWQTIILRLISILHLLFWCIVNYNNKQSLYMRKLKIGHSILVQLCAKSRQLLETGMCPKYVYIYVHHHPSNIIWLWDTGSAYHPHSGVKRNTSVHLLCLNSTELTGSQPNHFIPPTAAEAFNAEYAWSYTHIGPS